MEEVDILLVRVHCDVLDETVFYAKTGPIEPSVLEATDSWHCHELSA